VIDLPGYDRHATPRSLAAGLRAVRWFAVGVVLALGAFVAPNSLGGGAVIAVAVVAVWVGGAVLLASLAQRFPGRRSLPWRMYFLWARQTPRASIAVVAAAPLVGIGTWYASLVGAGLAVFYADEMRRQHERAVLASDSAGQASLTATEVETLALGSMSAESVRLTDNDPTGQDHWVVYRIRGRPYAVLNRDLWARRGAEREAVLALATAFVECTDKRRVLRDAVRRPAAFWTFLLAATVGIVIASPVTGRGPLFWLTLFVIWLLLAPADAVWAQANRSLLRAAFTRALTSNPGVAPGLAAWNQRRYMTGWPDPNPMALKYIFEPHLRLAEINQVAAHSRAQSA
jgi:hypothetical protein